MADNKAGEMTGHPSGVLQRSPPNQVACTVDKREAALHTKRRSGNEPMLNFNIDWDPVFSALLLPPLLPGAKGCVGSIDFPWSGLVWSGLMSSCLRLLRTVTIYYHERHHGRWFAINSVVGKLLSRWASRLHGTCARSSYTTAKRHIPDHFTRSASGRFRSGIYPA